MGGKPAEFDDAKLRAIARALTRWFEANARDLPWRRTRDPYAIWVSEIMLQQTRVDTVERHWGAFMDRFPDLASLASADEDAVLGQWSGLGYYRRARLLHRGAKHVHEELGGVLPSEAEQLREIPGVGPYTAGAIASIAFDRPAALVDGNVARVHSRLAAIEEPAEQDAKAKSHWRFVERVLGYGQPRVLAQALMELGATVCTPRSPSCLVCPVREQCRAHAKGLQDVIPAVKVKPKSPEQQLFALALRRGDQVLLERRAEEGLLAGLWCLPLFESGEALAAAASKRLGVSVRLDAEVAGTVKHVFTHRVWHVQVWPARAAKAAKVDGERLAWFGPEAQPEGGVPTLTRKLLRVLG